MQKFDFKGHGVRVIADDPHNPRWVAKDVAVALGYKNPADAVSRHCRGVANHDPIQDRLGRTQNVRTITEPDLYRLIVGSDLETAQEFERMVFEEVLPTIRKHGTYATDQALDEWLNDPDSMIQALTALKDEREKRRVLEQEAVANAPKVEYHDAFVADSDLMTFRDFANRAGVSEKALREVLMKRKWIYARTFERWSNKKRAKIHEYQYRAYADKKNYFQLVTHHDAPRVNGEPRRTLKLTPAGAAAVNRQLKIWGLV
ncbi:BRO family protein [Corynebacterium pseudopelargi]|uniref:BRO family protein n=1 Tax=Corynebacterium pseudopelargi TaxID=2080757 RepID=UPI0013DDAF86|nr:BRO family protein [Corynebacterium pseudopelargi]